MNVYTDPKLLDVAGALQAQPALLLSDGTQREAVAVKATGTDDSTSSQFAPKFAPTAGKSWVLESTIDKASSEAKEMRDSGAV